MKQFIPVFTFNFGDIELSSEDYNFLITEMSDKATTEYVETNKIDGAIFSEITIASEDQDDIHVIADFLTNNKIFNQ